MLVGVIACFISVFLLGIDGRFIEPWEYPRICQARSWMLSTGFTLAFGAMFSKVWRVHRLNTKTKADHAKVNARTVDIDITTTLDILLITLLSALDHIVVAAIRIITIIITSK
jgi:gamma-aminobutyric acid type B receptor